VSEVGSQKSGTRTASMRPVRPDSMHMYRLIQFRIQLCAGQSKLNSLTKQMFDAIEQIPEGIHDVYSKHVNETLMHGFALLLPS
jgi:hypothetical protein